MSASLTLHLVPGELAHGRPYVERDEREPEWHDRLALWVWHGAASRLISASGLRLLVARTFCARVNALAEQVAALDDAALRSRFAAQGAALRRHGFVREPTAVCFAIVREAASRVLGLRHFDPQIIAGWWLLGGHLTEMATGEGKTFAATLPACTAALAGLPVHVITVNDYLAARDAESMGPLYRFFGQSCAAVVHEMGRGERRRTYAGDISYVSNKELAFDYLRDRAALGDRASPMHLALAAIGRQAPDPERVVLRGLCFAIVDEADSVFIDEARTPLILSRTAQAGDVEQSCQETMALARQLQPGEHFDLDLSRRRVTLTAAGEDAAAGDQEEGDDTGDRAAREQLQRALSALWLYHRDEHYVVIDDKVQIVDASTGRVMPDRAWEQGLHQMIECKEGVPLTGRRDTLARITYQRLFRRYLRLSGMTGTATEVAVEIGRTYGLAVARVPLHRPSRRRLTGARCLPNAVAKWLAVADAVEEVAVRQGRPVLIGTRTVKASEQISAVLQERGVPHVVLNAKQDSDEAQLVAQAGEPGRVTVATNMAGRGTDIALGSGVAERGGLHVILTEYNESRRVDRQLIGRSARQGDPGSAEALVALDDEIFVTHAPWLALTLSGPGKGAPPGWALALLRRVAQGRMERLSGEAREGNLKHDRKLAQMLAFSGRGE